MSKQKTNFCIIIGCQLWTIMADPAARYSESEANPVQENGCTALGLALTLDAILDMIGNLSSHSEPEISLSYAAEGAFRTVVANGGGVVVLLQNVLAFLRG